MDILIAPGDSFFWAPVGVGVGVCTLPVVFPVPVGVAATVAGEVLAAVLFLATRLPGGRPV